MQGVLGSLGTLNIQGMAGCSIRWKRVRGARLAGHLKSNLLQTSGLMNPSTLNPQP